MILDGRNDGSIPGDAFEAFQNKEDKSAADIIKIAMIRIHDWLIKEKMKTKMIMQVHDELVFDVHESELDVVKQKVVHFMENAISLEVPLEVGTGVGNNWLEAH